MPAEPVHTESSSKIITILTVLTSGSNDPTHVFTADFTELWKLNCILNTATAAASFYMTACENLGYDPENSMVKKTCLET